MILATLERATNKKKGGGSRLRRKWNERHFAWAFNPLVLLYFIGGISNKIRQTFFFWSCLATTAIGLNHFAFLHRANVFVYV